MSHNCFLDVRWPPKTVFFGGPKNRHIKQNNIENQRPSRTVCVGPGLSVLNHVATLVLEPFLYMKLVPRWAWRNEEVAWVILCE